MLVAFFCADVIALGIYLAAKDVGCKPFCSDIVEHRVGKDVMLPSVIALMLCATILLRCYCALCQALMLLCLLVV